MRETCFVAIAAGALLAGGPTAQGEDPVIPADAVWVAYGQWDSWSEGGYDLYNNIWGSGAGPQTIWARSHSNWGAWADHPDTSGIKSYPNSGLADIGSRISGLASLTSTFNCSVPSGGAYETAYDIWSGRRNEIMLWMNKQGPVGPWADAYDQYGNPIPKATNLSVGGHTWNFYYNGGGSMKVYSFVRTTNTNAGTVDILAVLRWLLNNGWVSDLDMDKVQCGFEITSSAGGMNFVMNSFDVSYSTNSTAAPAAPSNLTATVAGATAVDLAWTDHANNEEGFKIERSLTSGSGFSEIATVGSNITSYTDSGLTTGTAYYYRVRAYNVGGNSAYSNEAGARPMALGNGTGLKGDYFDNADFTNLVLTRTDATVGFDWGNGAPDPSMGADTFSVRWTGYVQPLFTETYTFKTLSDDGDRLWVNGVQLTNDWAVQRRGKTSSGTITLTAGVKYPITVEFYENSGGALMKLSWSSASQAEEIIPQTQLYPQ